MTLFEYLAIAFSLTFSFSGMRLVGGLPHAVQRQRRSWVHLGFVFNQLLLTVGIFWMFWSFRAVEWNFPTFLLTLVSPSLIYFNSCALVPENPSAVESWHDYYYEVRSRYFVGLICWATALVAISTIVLELPFLHLARVPQAALFGGALVGALSKNERVHSSLAVFFLLSQVAFVLSLGFRPGSIVAP